MGSYTSNLSLFERDPSKEGSEKFSLAELLNNNWNKIDAAYATEHSTLTTLKNLSAAHGVYAYYGTYQGDGTQLSKTFKTTKKAFAFFMVGNGLNHLLFFRPVTVASYQWNGATYDQDVYGISWGNDSVTVSLTSYRTSSDKAGFNEDGQYYHWYALCTENGI